MSYIRIMNGKEFIRKVRKIARDNGVECYVTKKGKGSHQTLHYNENRTIVQVGQIPKGTFNNMCKQLGIDKDEL